MELEVSRIFLVHGKTSYIECGAKSILEEIFDDLNFSVVHFDDFTINPKYDDAIKGKNALIDSKSECIIAVGGGSVIDIAKLIRYYASLESFYNKLNCMSIIKQKAMQMHRFFFTPIASR